MQEPKWNCAFLPALHMYQLGEARGSHESSREGKGMKYVMSAASSQIRILAVDDHARPRARPSRELFSSCTFVGHGTQMSPSSLQDARIAA